MAAQARPFWSFAGAGLMGGYYLGVWERLAARDVSSSLFCAQRSPLLGASAGSIVAAAIGSGMSQAATADSFLRILSRVHEEAPRRGALGCDLLAIVRCAPNHTRPLPCRIIHGPSPVARPPRPELEAPLPEDAHERYIRNFTPGFSSAARLPRPELEALLPEDAHERCSGRVFVSLVDRSGLRWRTVRRSQFESRSALIDAVLCSSYIPCVLLDPRSGTEIRHFEGALRA